MNARIRCALPLCAILAVGTLRAQAPTNPPPSPGPGPMLRVLTVSRQDTLPMADSARGPARPYGGTWLVVRVEVASAGIDSDLTGDVTLSAAGLPRALELRGVSPDADRARAQFQRIIEYRGGGFIAPDGHVHWVTSRAGRVRLEVYGHVTFGLAFDAGTAAGPFELRFAGLTAVVQPPALLGAR